MLLINYSASGSIEKDSIRFHVRQEIFVNKVLSLGCGRCVNANNVTALEKILEGLCVLEAELLIKTCMLGTSVNNNIELESLGAFED
jgi:hypothetical protein